MYNFVAHAQIIPNYHIYRFYMMYSKEFTIKICSCFGNFSVTQSLVNKTGIKRDLIARIIWPYIFSKIL